MTGSNAQQKMTDQSFRSFIFITNGINYKKARDFSFQLLILQIKSICKEVAELIFTTPFCIVIYNILYNKC